MDTLLKIVQTINMYLSDYVLIILLLGAGLYFTIRTRMRWPTSRARTSRARSQ